MKKLVNDEKLKEVMIELFSHICNEEDVYHFCCEIGMPKHERDLMIENHLEKNSCHSMQHIGRKIYDIWRMSSDSPVYEADKLVLLQKHFFNVDKGGLFNRICSKHDLGKHSHFELELACPSTWHKNMKDLERLGVMLCSDLNLLDFMWMLQEIFWGYFSKSHLNANIMRTNLTGLINSNHRIERFQYFMKWLDMCYDSAASFLYVLRKFFLHAPSMTARTTFFTAVKSLQLNHKYRDVFQKDNFDEYSTKMWKANIPTLNLINNNL